MKAIFLGPLALLGLCALGLAALRLVDMGADRRVISGLGPASPTTRPVFDPAMIADLPEPAARFFTYVLSPGAPLHTAARITMQGELSLGTREDPGFRPMRATQILAPPRGFIWQVTLPGTVPVSGTDAATFGATPRSFSRFRIAGLIPVGRVAGDADHLRSSFGRMVGEGLFWTPAAFLPGADAGWDSVEWSAVGQDTAAVTVRRGPLTQRAAITVDAEGRPLRVVFPRWSNENPDRSYRLQPFGGDLSAFGSFCAQRLPTRVSGGNHYGTPEYHPFFQAEVTDITPLTGD